VCQRCVATKTATSENDTREVGRTTRRNGVNGWREGSKPCVLAANLYKFLLLWLRRQGGRRYRHAYPRTLGYLNPILPARRAAPKGSLAYEPARMSVLEAGRLKSRLLASGHFAPIAAFVLFSLTFVAYYFSGRGGATRFDYFVPLADGFLHGRLSIVHPSPLLEELVPGRDGALYVIYPPMPAILLLPQVAISGLKANQTLTSVFLGSLNASLVFLLMRRLTDSRRLQLWIAVLFGFGTIHWYLASLGPAWYLAHVVSFLFLTLAISATLSNRSLFLIGLLLGASYWARLPTILSLPFFMIMLSPRWLRNGSANRSIIRKVHFRSLGAFAAGVGVFVGANLLYNYLRFGTPRDIAYSIQARREPDLYPNGLFDLSYIPKHLYVFFLKTPVLRDHPPYVVPSVAGLSILITTPAFLYCARAGANRLAFACWSAIVPIASLDFVHGGTGWVQFGYRFGMDFYPFLLVLTALGMRSGLSKDGQLTRRQRLLILISILVNLWGVLWINKFGWAADLTHPP
jgi:hypothetical protein